MKKCDLVCWLFDLRFGSVFILRSHRNVGVPSVIFFRRRHPSGEFLNVKTVGTSSPSCSPCTDLRPPMMPPSTAGNHPVPTPPSTHGLRVHRNSTRLVILKSSPATVCQMLKIRLLSTDSRWFNGSRTTLNNEYCSCKYQCRYSRKRSTYCQIVWQILENVVQLL